MATIKVSKNEFRAAIQPLILCVFTGMLKSPESRARIEPHLAENKLLWAVNDALYAAASERNDNTVFTAARMASNGKSATVTSQTNVTEIGAECVSLVRSLALLEAKHGMRLTAELVPGDLWHWIWNKSSSLCASWESEAKFAKAAKVTAEAAGMLTISV